MCSLSQCLSASSFLLYFCLGAPVYFFFFFFPRLCFFFFSPPDCFPIFFFFFLFCPPECFPIFVFFFTAMEPTPERVRELQEQRRREGKRHLEPARFRRQAKRPPKRALSHIRCLCVSVLRRVGRKEHAQLLLVSCSQIRSATAARSGFLPDQSSFLSFTQKNPRRCGKDTPTNACPGGGSSGGFG